MEKVTVKGLTAYTSQELRDRLKSIISRYGGPLKEIFNKFVDEKNLVPIVVLEPTLFQKLIKIIKSQRPYNILGTFDGNKIYIVMSYKNSFDLRIYKTIVHEYIHYIMKNYNNHFVSVNKDIIFKFYELFYTKYFKSETYDNRLFSMFVDKMHEQDLEGISFLKNYRILEPSFKNHTLLDKKEFEKKLDDLLDYVYRTLRQKSVNITYPEIPSLLRQCYTKLFGGYDPLSRYDQETHYPSEIVAKLSVLRPRHPLVKKTLEILLK